MRKRPRRQVPLNRQVSLKKQLLTVQQQKHIFEMQHAEMGIFTPPYVLTQVDKLKKKEASLKGQITREEKRILQYNLPKRISMPVEHFGSGVGVIAILIIAAGIFGFWLARVPDNAEHTRVSPDRTSSGETQIVATQEPAQQSPVAGLKAATVVTPSHIGVRYRIAPDDSAVDSVNPQGPQEGEIVYLLERAERADGTWWKVQLQDGRVGYIREQFLSFQP
jgi:hypothetical protein